MGELVLILLVLLVALVLILIAVSAYRRSRRDQELRDLINQGNSRISVAPKRRRPHRQQMGHWEVMREPDEE